MFNMGDSFSYFGNLPFAVNCHHRGAADSGAMHTGPQRCGSGDLQRAGSADKDVGRGPGLKPVRTSLEESISAACRRGRSGSHRRCFCWD